MSAAAQKKVAVITGATSGMGLAIAHKLVAEGYALALVARDQKKLKETVSQLQGSETVIKYFSCDVTQGKEVLQLSKDLQKEFGTIHVLINNAGGSHTTTADDVFDEAFDKDIALNLKSVHLCCRLLHPLVVDSGVIINLSSVNGRGLLSHLPGKKGIKIGYSVAKAGVLQLTKIYAVELSPRGIRVNAVAPGVVYPTGMTDDWDENKRQATIELTPLKRLGTPKDIANAVSFLISEAASYITGHTLDVNGGRYMN
jgi:NAD(P)-dependent dehydrogenase (short-subunit alcohol dehydrogenase family)